MDEDRNLVRFKNEFIAAGVRKQLKRFYLRLIDMGACTKDKSADEVILSSGNPFVVLCTNEGLNSKFGVVKVLNWNWWNYYHNKKINKNRKVIRTINLPRQWKEVEKLLVTEEIPTLIAE